VAGWTSYSCGKEHVRRRRPNTPTGTSPDKLCDVNRRPTIGWVNGLFLRERTKTSRNVTISFSQSPERATATRGRVPLVLIYLFGKWRYVLLGTGGIQCLDIAFYLFGTDEVLPKTSKQCCILLSHCLYFISLLLVCHIGNRNCVHYTLKLVFFFAM
jgi:hypothetical protein